MGTDDAELDRLDASLTAWAREIPDLDPLTEGIVERIQILAKWFDRSLAETLTKYELDPRSYYLVGRLRSYGPPYRGSPGQLASDMHLSSGAMTNRLDRAEEAGLIRRLPDPDDRRGTLVEPTEEGHSAWDRSVGMQARREAMIGAVLEPAEREELHRLLRHLMRAFPGRQPKCNPTDDEPAARQAPGIEESPGGGPASRTADADDESVRAS